MSGFKIIALIPLDGCDLKFIKNLKIGQKYSFYQNYEIGLEKFNVCVSTVKDLNKEIEQKLYSNENEIDISISALVGENGSGKSSLIELFYYMVYYIGTRSKKKSNSAETIIDTSVDRINSELEAIEKLIEEWSNPLSAEESNVLLARIIEKYRIDVFYKGETKLMKQFIHEKLEEQKNRIKRRIDSAKEIEDMIKKSLNVALIFQTDQIYCAEIIKDKFSISTFIDGKKSVSTELKAFDLEGFFYSISVNYSHHSLNAHSIGEWINTLFHKNDGYQTPLVINPMRHDGNFNVNHENRLLKERLIGNVTFNLFKDHRYKLLGKYRFENFIFLTKLHTGDETLSFMLDKSDNPAINEILRLYKIKISSNDQIVSRALSYLDKKVFRIPEQYPFLFKSDISKDNYAELIAFIQKDSSHITKKILQTLHFLKNYGKTEKLKKIWKSEPLEKVVMSPADMRDWLDSFDEFSDPEKERSPYFFSLYSLPGFMTVDFEITDIEKGKKFRLSELSSGEQQIILNLSSISYHLNNIQSIHTKDDVRYKYKYVNIILDEIELYYHPDSQRKMVSELTSTIKEVPLENKGIKGVNIIFSTHSPFILSDIPSSNILRLKDGKPETVSGETFGANIHDLLANDFFLHESFMGKFAMDSINDLIIQIENNKVEYSREQQNMILQKIELIGENVLRNSLLDLFQRRFHNLSYEKLLSFYNSRNHETN